MEAAAVVVSVEGGREETSHFGLSGGERMAEKNRAATLKYLRSDSR